MSVPWSISLLVTTSLFSLSSSLFLFHMHHFASDIGARIHFPLLPWGAYGAHRMTAVGLFITVLKNGRMASLQEQMALHAWHNFLRQTNIRTVNTGFTCYSHPHQNITMKTRYLCGKGIEILNYIHLGDIGSCYVHITWLNFWHSLLSRILYVTGLFCIHLPIYSHKSSWLVMSENCI